MDDDATVRSTQRVPPGLVGLFARLRDHVARGTLEFGEQLPGIPVTHYTSSGRLEQERATAFRRHPLIVGHISELAPGSARAVDIAGLPVLLVRDEGGTVRAFLNVCRHRGMRLLDENGVCAKASIVCPYHGWTYALDGRLKHFLHAEAFPDVDPAKRGLVELPCEVRLGLVWVTPTPDLPMDIGRFLGPVEEEIGWLLGESVLYRRVDTVRAANWKLIIDAFLDGYHVRVLHRDSIYPFFMDALAAMERVGPHIRSAVARRRLSEAVNLAQSQWDFREHCSFTHYVFPNTIFIFHPDYASVMSVFPVDTDRLRWVHQMLIPASQNTGARRAHWEKTFNLIEGTVFQREDLFAAEGMQAGLRSGANESLTLGRFEHPIRYFHDTIQSAIDGKL